MTADLADVDPRQVRSRQALVQAITELLDTVSSFDEVTITEVVRRAGVSRPTFYLNFGDPSALVRAAAVARLEAAFAQIPAAALGQSWTAFARGSFRIQLGHLREHVAFYRMAFQGAGMELAADMIDFLADHLLEDSPLGPVIRRRPGPDTAEERAQFLGAGVVRLVRLWLETDFTGPNTVEAMVDRLSVLLVSSSGATEAEIEAVRTETDLERHHR